MNARAPVENVLQIALEIVKLKGAIHPQNQKFIFLPLPVEPFISLDSFGVSFLVLEISAVEISA